MAELDKSLIVVAKQLNRHFREGGIAGDVVDQLRQFPRPIVVDFNNVIANNEAPLQLNPDASRFLEELRKIGNLIIVTTAQSWQGVQGFFVVNKLWTPDMLLMTIPTYEFLHENRGDHPMAERLRAEFNKLALQNFGREFSDEELTGANVCKRIAPLFCKPWEIPIIDDSIFSTHNNPGMLGIQVKYWEPAEYGRWFDKRNTQLPSLLDAMEIVRNHYSKIGN